VKRYSVVLEVFGRVMVDLDAEDEDEAVEIIIAEMKSGDIDITDIDSYVDEIDWEEGAE